MNDEKQYISFEDFAKVEMRVGVVVAAEKVEGSDKLLKFKVNFGDLGEKQVLSGISKWYSPEDMMNKKTVFVVNMKPRSIMGMESEAMIMAVENSSGDVCLLNVDDSLSGGELLR